MSVSIAHFNSPFAGVRRFFFLLGHFLLAACLELVPGGKRPRNTIVPLEDNLDHQRRKFHFPTKACQMLFSWLQNDKQFLSLLPQDGQQYLLRFAVCGSQLRVNIHYVVEATRQEHQDSYAIEPIFSEFDERNGVFAYLFDRDRKAMRLIRRMPGLHYAPADVRLTYARDLELPELEEVDDMRIHDL